ncbi:hypothetical protein [Rhizobium sp. 21-4511-3d]
MSDPSLFPEEIAPRRPRSPNGINVHRFLEGYGVRVLPYTEARGWKERPSNVVYGGRTVARLMRKDIDRVGLVIRCIQESNPTCFDDVVIWSVWQFIGAHMAHRKPADVLNAFRAVDIAVIKKRAHRLTTGSYGRMSKTWPVIACLLADTIIEKEHAA